MTVLVLAIIAVLLVLGFGLLILALMRRSQKVVPDVADGRAADRERVVGVDEQGRPVTDAQEGPAPPKDNTAFEGILKDELDDLGREQPPAGDD